MKYRVVKFAVNSWTEDADGKQRPIVEDDCGHTHRSHSAAIHCRDRLVAYNRRSFPSGTCSWSAHWHGCVIVSDESDPYIFGDYSTSPTYDRPDNAS